MTDRERSRDVNHVREDLTASIAFALADRPEDLERSTTIVEYVTAYHDIEEALHRVRIFLGVTAFGHVTLFHLAAGTTLSNVSSQMTQPRALDIHDLNIYDLGWPASRLHAQFLEHAVDDPALDALLDAAVAEWKAAVGA